MKYEFYIKGFQCETQTIYGYKRNRKLWVINNLKFLFIDAVIRK